MKAICILRNYDNNSIYKNVYGEIVLESLHNNIKITGFVSGFPSNNSGYKGFHIHEYGDIRNGCDSVGSHYNPFNKEHGPPVLTNSNEIYINKNRHVGDLGNIYINSDGTANINIVDNLISLEGRYSIIGRSLVVHSDEDDLGFSTHPKSKTTGNSGTKVVCGIISIL